MRFATPVLAVLVSMFAISACDESLNSPTEYEGEPPAFVILDEYADSDNDGIPDLDDFWPDSDTRAFVEIGDCNSDIQNTVLSEGATLMDLVNTCMQENKPAKCLRELAKDLQASGAITKSELKALKKCIKAVK